MQKSILTIRFAKHQECLKIFNFAICHTYPNTAIHPLQNMKNVTELFLAKAFKKRSSTDKRVNGYIKNYHPLQEAGKRE